MRAAIPVGAGTIIVRPLASTACEQGQPADGDAQPISGSAACPRIAQPYPSTCLETPWTSGFIQSGDRWVDYRGGHLSEPADAVPEFSPQVGVVVATGGWESSLTRNRECR